MRIDVHDRVDCGDQTRAYAEYRVFSTLRNFGDIVQHAAVTLERRDDGTDQDVCCRVTITLTYGRRLDTAARGRHAYGAIDRVAAGIPALMPRQASVVT